VKIMMSAIIGLPMSQIYRDLRWQNRKVGRSGRGQMSIPIDKDTLFFLS
jgi:hypothetical protein